MPSEPVSIAAASDRMSPKRLSVTITSNCFGLRTSCMAQLSARMWLNWTSRVVLGDGARDFVPEDAGLHDVLLVGRVELLAAGAGEVEGDAADAVDLVGLVDLGVDGALLAVAEIGDLLGLAEIDAAGELADDQDVEAFDDLALERRGIGERGVADRGTEVGEELQVLAEAEEAGFGAHLVGDAVPLGAADRAEDDGVGTERLLHVLLGDRGAVLVVGAAADETGLELEVGKLLAVEPGDELFDLGHDLGADAVAGEEEERLACHSLSFRVCCPECPALLTGRCGQFNRRKVPCAQP